LVPDAAVEVVVAESDGELELAVDVLHAGADVIKTLLVFVADAQEKSLSVRPWQVFQVGATQVRQVPTCIDQQIKSFRRPVACTINK
jgi:hypothetical protein